MIKNTFQILERVAKAKELNLWHEGIDCWDTFLTTDDIKGISKTKKKYFNRQINNAKKALYNSDAAYFTNKIPTTETWRLYDFFKEDTVFLDIEADGLAGDADITVIGLYDGISTKTMIKGINLDFNILRNELKKYKLIVTFNGASFDLPFIKKRYDILPYTPHIDLKNTCARLNFTGGLKEIEKDFDIKRSNIIEKFSGGDPLTLWKMYKSTGDDYYLNLLVEYNEEDVINLKKILNYCYNKLSEEIRNEIHISVHHNDVHNAQWGFSPTLPVDRA